jgi:hypothetical protein
MNTVNTPEPAPLKNDGKPAIWGLVVEDMIERDKIGEAKYKTRLTAHNGRKPLIDAYQECLDLIVYLRQEVVEDNDRRVRLELCYAAMRKDGNGLTRTQEDEIRGALGYL